MEWLKAKWAALPTKKRIILGVVAAFLALIIVSEARASVTYNEYSKSLLITGQTDRLQVFTAEKIIKENKVGTIYLYGPGGDFYAGLRLGRAIRESGARVIIPEGENCISACAIAAVGSEEIHVDGELWFHRPFYVYVPAMLTIEEIAAKYGEGYMDLAKYMEEMGFGIGTTKQILAVSKPCKFIVIVDAKQIEDAKAADSFGPYLIRDFCNK